MLLICFCDVVGMRVYVKVFSFFLDMDFKDDVCIIGIVGIGGIGKIIIVKYFYEIYKFGFLFYYYFMENVVKFCREYGFLYL